ncbi:hypothetical protein IKG60_02440 [Candidatus Saccharibacteria bacterium]|nr:hypothetical protein [Candidatus Saccharibacteria bacterium]
MMRKVCSVALVFAMCVGLCVPAGSVYADDNNQGKCVKTSIIGGGEVCDNGDGASVMHILMLVVDIMSIGVGILGVVGISVVGVQYLTAGGSEEKTRKAKRRMFEIIIGLAAYVVLYAALKWLLPSFTGSGG